MKVNLVNEIEDVVAEDILDSNYELTLEQRQVILNIVMVKIEIIKDDIVKIVHGDNTPIHNFLSKDPNYWFNFDQPVHMIVFDYVRDYFEIDQMLFDMLNDSNYFDDNITNVEIENMVTFDLIFDVIQLVTNYIENLK